MNDFTKQRFKNHEVLDDKLVRPVIDHFKKTKHPLEDIVVALDYGKATSGIVARRFRQNLMIVADGEYSILLGVSNSKRQEFLSGENSSEFNPVAILSFDITEGGYVVKQIQSLPIDIMYTDKDAKRNNKKTLYRIDHKRILTSICMDIAFNDNAGFFIDSKNSLWYKETRFPEIYFEFPQEIELKPFTAEYANSGRDILRFFPYDGKLEQEEERIYFGAYPDRSFLSTIGLYVAGNIGEKAERTYDTLRTAS